MKLNAIDFLVGCISEYLSREHIDDRKRFCNLCAARFQSVFLEIEPTEIERLGIALARITSEASIDQEDSRKAH